MTTLEFRSAPESSGEVTPLLVIGMPRSGTKWLTNEIARHASVASVQSERHYGVLETNLLRRVGEKFDLSSEEDVVAFTELWSKSDFFNVTPLDKSELYRLVNASRDEAELFFSVMESVAVADGAQWWVQKFDPLNVVDILPELPGRVITIRRDAMSNVRSRVGLDLRSNREPAFYRHLFRYALQSRALSRIESLADVSINFESLKRDKDVVLRDIAERCGLAVSGFQGNPNPYEPNTSFKDGVSRDEVLSDWQEKTIRWLSPALHRAPGRTLETVRDLYRTFRTLPPSFVPGTFAELTESEFSDLE